MVTLIWCPKKEVCSFLCLFHSDELEEKELEIKLDITKKSRKINRPFSFIDQHGKYCKKNLDLWVLQKGTFNPVFCVQLGSWRRSGQMRRKRRSSSPAPLSPELYNVPQSTQRMRYYTLLRYVLGAEIQTTVLRVFLLAIHSHLYSFSLRFLFIQTHATSYSFCKREWCKTMRRNLNVHEFSFCSQRMSYSHQIL
jgi:hypothetical protein